MKLLKQLFKRKINSCAAMAIVGIALWTLPFLPGWWKARQFARALNAIHHPANTKLIAQMAESGQQIGSGPNRVHFVAQVRSFTGKEKDIEDFYRAVRIFDPITDAAVRTTDVAVFFPDSKDLGALGYPYDYATPPAWFLPQRSGEKVYIVYALTTDSSGLP